jgi:tetratricopeptide (TPR) repeat protein
MKAFVSQVVVALALVALGGALWIASAWERRAARADEALVTLRYEEPAIEYGGLENTMRPARGVPWLDGLIASVRERRAVAQYWQSTDVAPDRDPAVVFVVANATFRAAQRERDKVTMTRRLDDAIKQYAEALKANPDNEDAAYNYEYAVRVKNSLVKAKEVTAKAASAPPLEGELPTGPTIHGRPGAPPKGTDMGQFKVVTPLRPDERKEMKPQDAGKPTQRIRRG